MKSTTYIHAQICWLLGFLCLASPVSAQELLPTIDQFGEVPEFTPGHPPEAIQFLISPSEDHILIPSFLTPNGDGWNDRWEIRWDESVNPEDYSILITNNSGRIADRLEYLHAYWDGLGLPDGVYVYILIDKTTDTVIRRGGLTILRHSTTNN
ncbi:MAG: gliding motility-associated C-terminal domain-containing protein [Bacteroidota bacterium]